MSAGHGPEASGAAVDEGADDTEDADAEGTDATEGDGAGDASPASVDARLHAHSAIATKPAER